MASVLIVLSFLLFVVVLALIFAAVIITHRNFRERVAKSLNMRLLSVSLPRDIQKEGEDPKEKIAVMEQFYSAFSKLKNAHIAIEVAVPHVGEEIVFYISAPARIIGDAEKQIYSYFPNANIEEVQDYNIFNPSGAAFGAYAILERSTSLPIKTYTDLESDPLRGIAGALSKLKEIGEGAALQVLFKPAMGRRVRKTGIKIAKYLRKGKSLEEALKLVSEDPISKTIKTVSARKVEEQLGSSSEVSEELIKAIEKKSSKNHLEVNIRIIASAKTPAEAEDVERQIENVFGQFNYPVSNSIRFVHAKGGELKKLLFNFAYRLFDKKEKIVLSTEELTSIYHFPNVALEASRVKTAKARLTEAPVELPREGLLLGKNVFRGNERKIFLTQEDRRRHVYVVGQTGTGKTSLMKNMIVQDILNGEGVGLIDPHGDIAEDILGLIPKERYNDVVVVDPAELAMPIGLNMLEYDPRYPEQKTFIINELMNIFDKLYNLKETGGPIFEQYTRNALQLLMAYPERGYTILEIPKVLADKEFRKSLLENTTDVLVRDFWEKEAEKAGGEASLQNLVPYITSKFNAFLGNDYVRPIIAQSKSTIKFRDILDSKKILIVSLAKGRLGDISSSLLGLIIVGKILMAAFSRVDMKEADRKDFYLYIDEFQNFATDSIATILSEARKYKLNLTVAHQFIAQLEDDIRDAVFGNVGSILSFRVGAEDAETLAKQFAPVFNESDLINIDNFNLYAKLLSGGKTTRPFSMAVYRPQEGNSAVYTEVKRLSLSRYGRPKTEVDSEILARLKTIE
ncbi:MAG: DUF87 domain-containing protein [Candidatus Colwellbacteria bacterium]|nr:DUF87 domain-containing protein [Candidatus Colwellbacteria bacterium]